MYVIHEVEFFFLMKLFHTCVSHHQSAVWISEYSRSPLESYSRIGA